ncbi:hypothetical protein GOBAR_DD21740 [Gossypium barbadense]|nr:hypothetical protein GOBAR_DD21740 [Gossypium barbadense]
MENNAHTNAKAEEKRQSRRDKKPEISEDNNCSASENLSVQELVQEIASKFNSLHNPQHVTPDYCIFRIPGKISDENSAPYRYRYAFIGPLVYSSYLSAHREEEKQRYLAAFLLRAQPNTSLIDFITLIKGSLAKIRGRIMINQLGSHKAIVKMFNNLCKYIDVEKKNRYSSLFLKLNAYNAVPHHSWLAILKHQYFSSLWRGVATVAAIILLVLTMIQTIVAILSL